MHCMHKKSINDSERVLCILGIFILSHSFIKTLYYYVKYQIFSLFKVNVRGVSVLGVLGGLLPQYDLTAWETLRLEGKYFRGNLQTVTVV